MSDRISNDEGIKRGRRVRLVRFPILSKTYIKCPICNSKGCNVCNWTGEYEMDGNSFVEIQQPLIVKYIIDNQSTISTEISRLYGGQPEISTDRVVGNYEIIRIDSLSGSIWIAFNLKEMESPKYFHNEKEMEKWLA